SNGAQNVHVFGSVARGEENPRSDVDFLVKFESGRSLLDMSGLQLELEELLGRQVQVVQIPSTISGARQRIAERILSEAVPL
ncbi:MAG: nucleotidyltransferase family protein, partial [Candidatus Dormibacteraceae bacterium]